MPADFAKSLTAGKPDRPNGTKSRFQTSQVHQKWTPGTSQVYGRAMPACVKGNGTFLWPRTSGSLGQIYISRLGASLTAAASGPCGHVIRCVTSAGIRRVHDRYMTGSARSSP
jgi:hypothetical protein